MVALTLDKMVELMAAQEKFSEAECLSERAVHIRSLHLADGYARQAITYMKEHKPELALPIFEHSLALDPDSEYAQKGYARTLKKLHRNKGAAEMEKRPGGK